MHDDAFFPSTASAKTLVQQLLSGEPWVLIQVTQTQGSVPREAGTWMAASPQSVMGTIGGGHLEHQAIALAREGLRTGALKPEVKMTLGPSLGQCCGGVVVLGFERLHAHDAQSLSTRLQEPRRSVALFGGGHVGRALVAALAPLPYRIHWVDSRDEIFPDPLPSQVHAEHSHPVQDSVWDVPADSAVLIMSFSHAEDLDIVAECLKRRRAQNDLPFIGLIGSKTKWASFQHRLRDKGFTQEELSGVTCPIGLPGIEGKQPEVIAIAVAAQLLKEHAPQASPQTS